MENDIDGPEIEGVHPQTLEQTNPYFITAILSLGSGVFSIYGWIILFGSVAGYFLWRNSSKKFEQWRESAEYHKNPDKFISRENAVQTARQRLQEEYEQKSREHAIKLKEEEEERKAAAAAKVPTTSTCTKPSTSKTDKKSRGVRTGFNPLMSDTRSSSFRPGRRSGGG